MLWLVALILGWLLVEGQPSAGGHWTAPHLLTLQAAHGGFGLLLLGVAACLWGAGKRVLGWGFVCMLALGTWLPFVCLDAPFFRLGPWVAFGLMALLGVAFRWAPKPALEPDPESSPVPTDVLILGGVGIALVLHGLARLLGRLSYGAPDSTSITLAAFITLMGVGAFAFGRPLPTDDSKRHRLLGFVWIGIMVAAIAALRAEQTLGTSRGLRTLMRRFGLDLSDAGTTYGDLLTSVSVLILPAFVLGTLVIALRRARTLSKVVLGAALGTLLVPNLLLQEALPASNLQPSVRLAFWGMAILAFVGPLTWWRQGLRVGAAVALAGCVVLVAVLPKAPVLIPRPWQRTQVEPVWEMETPAGQLTVTADGRGAFQALLDQVPLTADAEDARLHDRCLALSVEWALEELRENPSVLLIGVLSPQMSERLQSMGVGRIDRLTPFDAQIARACESALAGGMGPAPELGDCIDAQEAERRWKEGRYALALALPVNSASVRAPQWAETDQALAVVWNSLEGLRGTVHSNRTGWLCSDGLARFALVYTSRDVGTRTSHVGAIPVRLGASSGAISRGHWGSLRPWERPPVALSHALDRVAMGAQGNDGKLFSALARIAAQQVHSSPFETEFERYELTRESTATLTELLTLGPKDAFHVEIAGGLARTLVGKRDVAAIMEFLPGLSNAMGEPYELERSIARAELESLEPAAAARRLLRLRKAWPLENSLLEELGTALDQSQQAAQAVGVWNALRELHPDEWHFQKAWTLSLVRAGDPRAPEALRTALASHPEDPDLLAVSHSGPTPQVEKGFQPRTHRHEGHEDGE